MLYLLPQTTKKKFIFFTKILKVIPKTFSAHKVIDFQTLIHTKLESTSASVAYI